jgi:hypothetical protein
MNNINNLIELTPLGIIKVEGIDAEKFLQGQLTCDVREVTEQQSRLGAHCDHKGRIQATFRLLKYQNDFYIQIPKNLIEHLLQCLKKYAVFSKVTLTNVSESWQQLGICGDNCPALLKEFVSEKLPEMIDAVICLNNLLILQLPGNQPRFSLLGSNLAIEPLKQFLLPQCQPADFNYWQMLDIAMGIPAIYPETIGLFTPHQINFTNINGVSFNKGCYTGQEIIARMQYLGKLKQHMYKITFTCLQPITPGAKIIMMNQEKSDECGQLIHAVNMHDNKWLGLATIFDNAISQKLYIENADQPILDIQNLSYTTPNSL